MKKIYLLLLLLVIFTTTLSAQTVSYTDCYTNNLGSGKILYFVPNGVDLVTGRTTYADSGPDGEGTVYRLQYCTTISTGPGTYTAGWGIYPAGDNCLGSTYMYNASNTLTPPPVGVGVWTRQPGTTNPCTDNQIVMGVPPILTTSAAGSITSTTATLAGAITSVGNTNASYGTTPGATIIERGIVYGTATYPTLANSKLSSGAGNGAISLAATGLSPNTIYNVRSFATSSLGTGYGPNVAFLTAPAVPNTPTASSFSTTGYTLSWTAVSGATSYRLDVSTVSNFASLVSGFQDLTVNGTSRAVTGLTAGTTYYFRVRAVNSGGTSGSSTVGNQITVPAAPSTPTASIISTTGFTANWAATTGAASYRLDVSTVSNFASFVSALNDLSVGGTSSAISGLTAGTTYYFRVRAVNAAGTSASSTVASQITTPAAPATPTASLLGQTAFTVSWGAVTGAVNYRLDVSADGFSSFVSGYSDLTVNATSQALTGLAPGVQYSFRVRAVNAAGTSANSTANTQYTYPATPTTPSASAVSTTGFTMNWTTVSGANSYLVDVSTINDFSVNIGYTNFAAGSNTTAITGLTPGTTYYYRVRSLNSAGTSTNSPTSNLIMLPTAPPTPTASAVTTSGFTVNWVAVTGASSYRLDVSSNGFTSNVVGYSDLTVNATSQVVTGLASGSYSFRVRAFNASGASANSATGTQSLNAAPVIGGAVAAQAVTDKTTVLPFSAVTITDAETAQVQTVTVTLDAIAKGTFTTLNGFTGPVGNVYSYTGTAANAQTTIRGLVFTPTVNRVAPQTTETTTFTISVNDGVATTVTNNTTTVVSTAVNDAPAIAGIVTNQAVTDKTTISPFSGVTLTDVDLPAQTQTVTVTLDAAAKGTFTTLNGFTGPVGGVYTYSGTAANAQTAIRGLVFTPGANRVAPSSTETTTFTISVNDGVAAVVTNNSTTVISNSINDAPTIGGAVASQAVNDNSTISPFTGVTISDSDFPAQTQTVTVALDAIAKGTFITLNGFTGPVGNVYSYSGTAGNVQTAIRGLVFTPTTNRVAPGSTETTTFTISVNDGMASATTNNTTTVVSTSINNAPTIAGAVTAQAVNDNATISPFTAVTIMDADFPAQTQTVTITLDAAAKGTFTTLNGFTGPVGAVYSYTGTAANVETAIRGLVFTPTRNRVAPGSTETTTFTISVNDGINVASTNVTSVVSTSVNDAPVIGGTVASQAVNDKSNISLFSTVTIADGDSPAQTQVVTVVLDDAAKGTFTALNGFSNAIAGTYTYSGTAANAQTAIRGIVFTPTANRVAIGSTETTTFTIAVNDGVASVIINTNTTVVTTPVNDAPVVVAGGSLAYTEGSVAAVINAGITVTDIDHSDLISGTVTIGNLVNGDVLIAPAVGNITTFYNSTTGIMTLSGADVIANYQQVLRGISFRNNSQNPTNYGAAPSRTISFVLNDGVANSTATTTTVNITAINHLPVIVAGGTLAYTELASATAINSTMTVTDVDHTNIASATITIGSFVSGDMLNAVLTGGISQNYDPLTGVLNLTGSTTLANYQQVLQSITFRNTTSNPTAYGTSPSRTISYVANDAVGNSLTATNTINITVTNDRPILTANNSSFYTEGGSATIVSPSILLDDVDHTTITSATISLSNFVTGDVMTATVTGNISQNYDSLTGVLTLTGSELVASYRQALRSITYSNSTQNPTNYGANTARIVSFVANDGLSNSIAVTSTMVITPINQVAVIAANGTLSYTEGDVATAINSAMTVTDVDNNTLASSTVSIGNFFAGDILNATVISGIAQSYNSSTGVLSLTGSSSLANYQQVLQSITYRTTSTNPTNFAANSSRSVAYVVNDGTGSSTTATNTINITAINTVPIVTAGTTITYTENATNTIVDNTITITDGDNTQLTGATVSIANFVDNDILSFANTAQITGSYNGSTGILTLSGTTTLANYQAALRSLTFYSVSDNPAANNTKPSRTISFVVNDGTSNSTAAASTININAVNDYPVLLGASTVSYTEKGSALAIHPTIAVSDVDNPELNSASLIINNFVAGDILTFTNQNNITGSYNSATGILNLAGLSSVANYQTALQSITYSSTSSNPTVGGTVNTRTIRFSVIDSDSGDPGMSNMLTALINLTSVNDAPIITAGNTITYTENASSLVIDAGVTVSDGDHANLVSTTIGIGNFSTGDVLSFVNTAQITGSYNASTGMLTLSGTTTLANYQTALRSIRFSSTSDDPTANGTKPSRTISFVANDGTDNSLAATSTINITAINDAPVLFSPTTIGYTENAAATVINNSVTIYDADNTQAASATITIANFATGDVLSFINTAEITGSYNSSTGVLTLTGPTTLVDYQAALRSIQYSSTSDNPTLYGARIFRTINFQVTDTGNGFSNSLTSTVNITATNDSPVVTAGNTINYTEIATAVTIDNTITIADSDNTTLTSARINISPYFVTGDQLTFTNMFNITGSYDAATGILDLTGTETLANYQTALRSIKFSSTSANPTQGGSIPARTVFFRVGDGTGFNSPSPWCTINITSVNDLPVLTGTSTLNYTENGGNTAINTTITVADADHVNLTSATISLSNFSTGDVLSFTNTANIIGNYNSSTGVLTLTGSETVAGYQSALRAVAFRSTSENPTLNGAVLARSVAFVVNDGNGASNVINSTINITAVNDLPLVANAIPSQNAIEDTAFSFAFAPDTFWDIDNALTYTARLVGGAALPSWLTFTSATRTFSGTPRASDIGSLAIEVIANDGTATISTNFNLTIDPATRDITNATYDGFTGILTVTGTYFKANASGADINLAKFTITGEDNATYILTSPNVEITNATTFSVTLNSADRAAFVSLFTKNGTSSKNGITYNIAAAGDWLTASTGFADPSSNQILASNVTEIPVPLTTTETAITAYTATLNGTIDPKFGNLSAGAFVVSKNANLSNPVTVPAFSPVNTSITSAMSATAVTTSLTGLTSKTTYYYQLTATNSAGQGKSAIQSFITLPSVNANLSNLAINNGVVLNPIFSTSTLNYTAEVGNAIASIKATPTLEDNTATVKVNTANVANTVASADLPLAIGLNTISTVVTAEDGLTTKTYTLTINRRAAQTLTFAATATTTFGTVDFDPGATSTNAGIPIVYSSSDTNVATIVGGKIHILTAGTVTISANQAGDVNYDSAPTATQTLTINKAGQVIAFAVLPNKTFNDPTFNLNATGGGSNNTITYVSSNTGVATITGNVVTIVGAGTTTITAAQLGNVDYLAAPSADQLLTVDKATATLTLSNLAHTYNGSAKSATVTTTPNGLLGISITYNGAATAPTAAATYAVLGTLTNANYTAANVTGNLVIGPLAVSVTADAKTKIYGEIDPALTYTFSPALISGDGFTGALSRATGEHIGDYAIAQNNLALSSNYTLTYTPANLSIGKKTITVLAEAKTKTYGNADPTLTYTFSPALISGDSFSGTLNRATGEQIGNYAIGQNTLALSSDYTLNYTAADLVIGKKTITVLADAKTKIYGAADPILTYTFSPALTTGDSFSGSLNRPTGENIGNYAIGQNTLALNSNYTLNYTTADLVIDKKTITVVADAKTKTYGDVDPALTYTFSPALITGDSFTGNIGRAAGENIGNYAIGQNNLALSSNYTLNYTTADLVINKLTIAVSAVAKTKTYGETDPVLTYTFTPALVVGDSFTGTLNRVLGEHIGNYAIALNTLALNSNYTLNYTGADLVIGKQIINVAAVAKNKSYGDVDPTLTYTFSPALVSGDSFTGSLGRATGEHIGDYAISQNTLALSTDYTLIYTGANLTVGKKIIDVSAVAKSKIYGETDPALTYTFSPALVSGDSFTGVLSRATGEHIGNYAIGQNSLALSTDYTLNYTSADMVIGKKTVTVLADAKAKIYGEADPSLTYTFSPALISGDSFSGNISRAIGENFGNYAIGQNNLALSSNYTLNYTSADLTIDKKTVTVLADAKSKTYGEADPVLTYTFSPALIAGDSFTGNISRANGEDIGNYAIVQNSLALNSNYTLNYTSANLTIGKKTVTVLADAKSKTYGDADPSLTYTFSPALVSGDSFTGTLSRAIGENIGDYAIGQGTLALNSNYTLTYTGANLSIGKKVIAVTAVAKSKTYGDADPSLTYTFSPTLVSGDSFTGTLSRAIGENIGDYAIGQGTLALNSNYTLTYTGANLSIGKKAIAVTAIAKSKTYGEADPTLTYTFAPALVTGDAFTGNISRAVGENFGDYAIGLGTLALNGNYTLTYTGANLSIGKKAIAVAVAAKSKTYGDADPTLTYTFAPALVTGDEFTGNISRATGENFGTYAIQQGSLTLSSNYTLNFSGADFTIGKKAIAVTAIAKNKTYGEADPTLT
ncbi:MAG: hypothetical protein EOP51_07030, partial [Sphingobacteriales bacterium]